MAMDYTWKDKEILKQRIEYTGIHPQKFALWLAMASMTMFFAALTSALIVKKADVQNWENFKLPGIFLYSTMAVLAVSLFMHLSLIHYRKSNFATFRWLLFGGTLSACLFLFLQWRGWQILTASGMPIDGNLSGSFIYLITSMHGLHIIGALIVTLVFLVNAIRARKDPIYELRNIANPKRIFNLEMLVTFWHYIDIVWIYLYIFFYLNYQ
ncbi:MAG: cytochrome c oxidase subunit 3 [Chitinophagales bacterium]|nr:cytochrome c oxidase subunit 3 [Chitinophagales bacterium]MDW8272622.1 cytochrome c oxidase subunit 3 [Chitinophagales bacterium]